MEIEKLVSKYDNAMFHPFYQELYGESDFYNYGYWDESVKSQEEASLLLIEKLLEFLPSRRGRILDVACGKGASTKYLLKYYRPNDIIGINISMKQIETCRQNVPNVQFYQMNATRLSFENDQFETMLCIESAFHFDTRQNFLRQAYRVLKNEGYLILSDILLRKPFLGGKRYYPQENYVPSLKAYEALYKKVGFHDVEVVDFTTACWMGHRRNLLRYVFSKVLTRKTDFVTIGSLLMVLAKEHLMIKNYVLVSAKK